MIKEHSLCFEWKGHSPRRALLNKARDWTWECPVWETPGWRNSLYRYPLPPSMWLLLQSYLKKKDLTHSHTASISQKWDSNSGLPNSEAWVLSTLPSPARRRWKMIFLLNLIPDEKLFMPWAFLILSRWVPASWANKTGNERNVVSTYELVVSLCMVSHTHTHTQTLQIRL